MLLLFTEYVLYILYVCKNYNELTNVYICILFQGLVVEHLLACPCHWQATPSTHRANSSSLHETKIPGPGARPGSLYERPFSLVDSLPGRTQRWLSAAPMCALLPRGYSAPVQICHLILRSWELFRPKGTEMGSLTKPPREPIWLCTCISLA